MTQSERPTTPLKTTRSSIMISVEPSLTLRELLAHLVPRWARRSSRRS